jgi:hypothetical protein
MDNFYALLLCPITHVHSSLRALPLRLKADVTHVGPACAGFREGPGHFGSFVRSLSLHPLPLRLVI